MEHFLNQMTPKQQMMWVHSQQVKNYSHEVLKIREFITEDWC